MLLPLLFLPGLLCDATLWRAQIDSLADIAAPAVADLTLDSTISAMADRALAAAPSKFSLVALSMGGYVAFEIMRKARDRVTRLALLDTSASPDTAERAAQRKSSLELLKLGRFRGVTDRLLPHLIHDKHLDGPVGLQVKSMAERVGATAFARQQQAILDRRDSRPFLSEIAVPTLVAVGQDDRLTPLMQSKEIHDAIKGSNFHVFGQCGHLPALEQPDEVSILLRDWLSKS